MEDLCGGDGPSCFQAFDYCWVILYDLRQVIVADKK